MITDKKEALELIKNQDDVDRVRGMLNEWEEYLNSGPMDDEQEWSDELQAVLDAQKAMSKIRDLLHRTKISMDVMDEIYGTIKG